MLGSVNVKSKKAIILAFQKGYRVNENGDVISPKGRILKKQVSNRNDIPYFSFSIRLDKYDVCKIMIHRFVAYLKYGDLMFNCECIRHLNGNSLDNSFENIEVGSLRHPKGDKKKVGNNSESFIYDEMGFG